MPPDPQSWVIALIIYNWSVSKLEWAEIASILIVVSHRPDGLQAN